jgi:hypothetical protein
MFEIVRLWPLGVDVCIKLTTFRQPSFTDRLQLLRCEHGRS